MVIHQDVERILFSKTKLIRSIKKLARRISQEYQGKEIVVVGILKGCVPFFHELFSRLTCEATMDFMLVTSYSSGSKSNEDPKIILDLITDIENKHVLLIDDIVDGGFTIHKIKNLLLSRKPQSIKIAVLLNKNNPRRKRIVHIDYYCYDVEDEFVVGFGFDYKEKYRNLPYVGALKKKIYDNIK